MHEAQRIAEQARRMIHGDAWHGPSAHELLADVDATAAAAHPVAGAHSIWELVLHIIATHDVLLRRLRGEAAGQAEDFWREEAMASESEWADTRGRLDHKEAKLRHAIAAFTDARLEAPLIAGGSSAYDNFHGHIQHNAYHLGQIGLLKKLV